MKLLLHMCCAPCSIYPVGMLKGDGIDVGGLFYNPNIHPIEEFLKRRENAEIFCRDMNIPLDITSDFKQSDL